MGLYMMVTPTRLVASHVIVIPLVGDSFQAQHLYKKEKCVAALLMFQIWGLLGFVAMRLIPIAQ